MPSLHSSYYYINTQKLKEGGGGRSWRHNILYSNSSEFHESKSRRGPALTLAKDTHKNFP